MAQNNNQANGHAHSGFPWSHVFGFILSLALTFLALYVALYNIATFNSLNNYYHNGCCASIVTINYVHAFKRRRRKSSNSYNDIQFLRCNCNSWFNCMDLLLNVMYMKRLLRFLSSLLSPITSTLRN